MPTIMRNGWKNILTILKIRAKDMAIVQAIACLKIVDMRCVE